GLIKSNQGKNNIDCFLFTCYRTNHALHPFPTRRSSDLGAGEHARELARRVPALGRIEPDADDAVAKRKRRVEGALGVGLDSSERDRKSTRLNSSHVAISYAVFCLKKKKHIHITTVRSSS